MSFSVLVIAVVAVAIVGVGIYLSLSKEGEGASEQHKIKELVVHPEKRQRKSAGERKNTKKSVVPELSKEEQERRRQAELAFYSAKKALYQYLNQSLKTMDYYFKKDMWEELESLKGMTEELATMYPKIVASLSEESAQLVRQFWACIEITTETRLEPKDVNQELSMEDGQIIIPEMEEVTVYVSKVKNKGALKIFFLNTMLPFYSLYIKQLQYGIRYNALIDTDMLEVFHELTGKKFRLGYKNKYTTGVLAYEVQDKLYLVFDKDGNRLCEASFKDGKVHTGFASIPVPEKSDDEWIVMESGYWKDGVLQTGAVLYKYQVQCN